MTATDELRGYALSVRNVALRTTSLCHEARRDLLDSAVRMEQAADTIESLRDRLQPVPAELDCIEDKSRWYELFGTPERAARTLADLQTCSLGFDLECDECAVYSLCQSGARNDRDALLEWLRSDEE